MREFTKALFSYSLAMSFFGLKQMQNLVTPSDPDEHKGPATKAFESVTNATAGQFGETLSSAFRMMDNVQRGLVSLTFRFLMPCSGGSGRESAGGRGTGGGGTASGGSAARRGDGVSRVCHRCQAARHGGVGESARPGASDGG